MSDYDPVPRIIVDPDGCEWWSTRKVAEELGVRVQTIWNWLHVRPSRFPVEQKKFPRNKSMYFRGKDVKKAGEFAKSDSVQAGKGESRRRHTPEQEAVIRDTERYSVAEAAAITGITPNTINMKRYRLRQRGIIQ